MGFLEVLTIIFIAGHYIPFGGLETWSWVWLLSPLWIGYGVGLLLLFVFGLFGIGITALFGRR